MGKLKKGGEDTRGLKAKQQKAQARQEKEGIRAAAKKVQEDKEWDEGSNQRAKKKAEEAAEKERKRLELLAAKKAAEAGDELEISQMRQSRKAKKAQKGKKKKKNDFSLLDEYMKEESKAKTKKKGNSRVSEQVPLKQNLNRQRAEDEAKGIYSATGIDNALAAVDLSKKSSTDAVDKHPERRMKAKFKEYEETALPRLKEEYPGLKLSQLKDKLWKEWQKSPENPMNQVA